MRRRAPWAQLLLGSALGCGLLAVPAHATEPPPPEPTGGVSTLARVAGPGSSLPDRIGVRASTRQLVTVTSRRWSDTRAILRAWRRTPTGWLQVGGSARVRLGYGGWVAAAQRVQSTGTTPAGRFSLPYAFGRLADPGTSFPYRRFDGNDWWPYEPRDAATYNVWQWHKAAATRWRPEKSERLADYPHQYAYAVLVGFNQPSGVHYSRSRRQWVAQNRADTDRGGGIFLHVHGDGLTAGCVSMQKPVMRWLIRWLRPTSDARVVMGPRSSLNRP